MTKKYWLDWQKRIGETKNIELFSYHLGRKMKLHLLLNRDDRLIKAKFNGDTVDLVIERHMMGLNSWTIYTHVENEYRRIHREEISNIIFKRRIKPNC